ncbi:MAG TPA: PAS domain-containing protein [Bacteroidales bacterium]|nr:PAS domain-containing protein [Bacteroidales bacterium]
MILFKGISVKTKYYISIALIAVIVIIGGLFLLDLYNSFIKDEAINLSSNDFQDRKTSLINLLITYIIIVTVITILIVTIYKSNIRDLTKLLEFSKKTVQGKRPDKIYLTANSELYEISENLNLFTEKLDEKINVLKKADDIQVTSEYTPENTDILANEIKAITEKFSVSRAEANSNQEAENIRIWTSEGIAQFGEILRSEREDVKELSFLIVQKLVTYLNIEMGSLFLSFTTDKGEKALQTIASYAYDRRKYLNKIFLFGEGLPGTCALEKEKIYINEIPEDYSDVISGVGQTKPKYVLLVPLVIENEIFGILELASLRGLLPHEMSLIDELADSIAGTLLAVKNTERTNQLLQQSREQAEKLLQQEEELRINLSKLEKANADAEKKESEITGILNAMNESSLVAEFNLNGRFTHINQKFSDLLELSKEQILGKHHQEFAKVNRYSEEYKKFWNALREGNNISNEEVFTLFSGEEIWLQQNYTPIINHDGKVYKILNIALDITDVKRQQEDLKKQAGEITRKNLEMKSLEQAVDGSIIKCEMDSEGIVLDVNSSFTRATGLSRKEVLGRNYRLFLKDFEKDQFEKIWENIMKGKIYEGAIRRTKPTGEEVWLMATYSPVENENGEIYKIYFLALDITEKKLKYQLLEEANKEIERLKELLQKS